MALTMVRGKYLAYFFSFPGVPFYLTIPCVLLTDQNLEIEPPNIFFPDLNYKNRYRELTLHTWDTHWKNQPYIKPISWTSAIRNSRREEMPYAYQPPPPSTSHLIKRHILSPSPCPISTNKRFQLIKSLPVLNTSLSPYLTERPLLPH